MKEPVKIRNNTHTLIRISGMGTNTKRLHSNYIYYFQEEKGKPEKSGENVSRSVVSDSLWPHGL